MAQTERLRVRRHHTNTPLARAHERALFTRTHQRVRRIPWDAFERDRYPQPALDLFAHAMRGLAFGEYGAVDNFARLASALALNGAPFDLVAAATQIPADEIRHAEYALTMAQLCTDADADFVLDRRAFEKSWKKSVDQGALDVLMVQLPTISETLAAALLTACRDRATDPVAKAMFSVIVSDEVHHLRLGWYYFAWRSKHWTKKDQQRVADAAGEMIVHVERQFWKGRDAPRGSKAPARALGVLDSRTQREVVRRVMEDEIVPGLDALGLGASAAWRVRRRGGG